ncbi:TerB family tellurite resistance protein [bacterium]|nr:TerB family tellurite resistance protein [bacterium]
MATWKGTAIGAAIGLFAVGPLGAIVGAVIGHGYDKKADRERADQVHGYGRGGSAESTSGYSQKEHYYDPRRPSGRVRDLSDSDVTAEERQLVFVTNLATLLVSVAMADGVFRPEEDRAIQAFFRRNGFAGSDLDFIQRLTKEVELKKPDLAAVCAEFKRVSKPQERTLLLRTLYMVAMSDREFHHEEQRVIDKIAKHLDISNAEKKSIASEFVSDEQRGCQILGVSEYASNDEIKKAYREQASKYHPDRVSHLGKEFIELANQRFQVINEAYQTLRKKRGF